MLAAFALPLAAGCAEPSGPATPVDASTPEAGRGEAATDDVTADAGVDATLGDGSSEGGSSEAGVDATLGDGSSEGGSSDGGSAADTARPCTTGAGAPTDAGPPGDAGCVTVACTPSNPCHAGTTSCGTGVPVCLDTRVNVPAGTWCGSAQTCDANGTCAPIACVPVPGNVPNCVPRHPCDVGHCSNATGPCDDLTAMHLLGAAADGTPCGNNADSLVGVCQQGECVVPGCVDGGTCDPECANDAGAALPQGTVCGVDQICVAGHCTIDLTVTGAPFTPTQGSPFTGRVATVTHANLADAPGDLTSVVQWGDGTSTLATLAGGAGSLTVTGTHEYATSGAFQVTVTVASASATVSATFGVSTDITEFSLPGGATPGVIAAGPDGNLWFGRASNGIGRITPQGTSFTTFAIPASPLGTVEGLTVGADGNLWFTLDRPNVVGRITTAGAITQFTIPTASSNPWAIAAGADGNLWFVEGASDTIGRITPGGVFTEFPLQTSQDRLWGACAGPDGNVWFTEYIGNRIGRITPQGTITEFTIPTANSSPASITAGPDGNLWFVEVAASQVGRISTAGVFTEFSLSDPHADLNDIARGPDGNLWFVLYDTNRIGRITTCGALTFFDVPTPNSGTQFIAAGPDGNLWFTEAFAGKVGRIAP